MDEPLPPAAEPPKIVALALAFEGGIALFACAVGWFMDPPVWRRIEWNNDDLGLGLLATVPMLLGLWAIRHARRGPLGRLNRVVDELLAPLFAGSSVAQLALVSLLAGVGEELLFRGVLQPLLIGWLERVAGVAIASIVFGLLHAVTPTYAVLAAAVGAYLGWLAVATSNLLAPMVAHALYDFLALVYVTRTASHARSGNATDRGSASNDPTIPPAA